MNDDERELERAFGALRREDVRRAPSFEELRGRPRRAARRSPWAVAGPVASVLAVAAVVLVWCRTSTDESRVAFAPAAPSPPAAAPAGDEPGGVALGGVAGTAGSTVDEAPLDFLLATPGVALRGIPDFDTSSLRGSLR